MYYTYTIKSYRGGSSRITHERTVRVPYEPDADTILARLRHCGSRAWAVSTNRHWSAAEAPPNGYAIQTGYAIRKSDNS